MRAILAGIGILALIGGVASLAYGLCPPGFVFAIWGVLLIAGTAFERVIYKRTLLARPGHGWERTTERFVDAQTGQPVTVYVEPATGERAYVQE